MAAPADSADLILVGRIGAAHGIRGEVRLAAFTADPMAIAGYGPLITKAGGTLAIVSARAHKAGLVARFEGVADRNAAEALAGTELYIPRDRLPPPGDEDEFYHADLVGLLARDPTGAPLGTVVAVQNYGAGDLIELREPSGRTVLYPFTRTVVPEVDIPGGFVVVAPPAEIPGEDEAP